MHATVTAELPLLLGHRSDSLSRHSNQIKSMTLLRGDLFISNQWVDTTWEWPMMDVAQATSWSCYPPLWGRIMASASFDVKLKCIIHVKSLVWLQLTHLLLLCWHFTVETLPLQGGGSHLQPNLKGGNCLFSTSVFQHHRVIVVPGATTWNYEQAP